MNHIEKRRLNDHRKANGTEWVSPKKARKADREARNKNWVAQTRDELLQKDNAGERSATLKLVEAGVEFEREHYVMCNAAGKPRQAFIDFYVTAVPLEKRKRSCRIAVEVDGSMHNSPLAKQRDRQRDADMMRDGVVDVILRVPSHIAVRWSVDQWRSAVVSASYLPKSVVNVQG